MPVSPDAAYKSPVSSTQAVTVAAPLSSVTPLLSTFKTCSNKRTPPQQAPWTVPMVTPHTCFATLLVL